MRISGGRRDAWDETSGCETCAVGWGISCMRDHCAGVAATGSEGKKVDLLKSSSSLSEDVEDGAGEWVRYMVGAGRDDDRAVDGGGAGGDGGGTRSQGRTGTSLGRRRERQRWQRRATGDRRQAAGGRRQA